MPENPELAHRLEELRHLIATSETMAHMAAKEFDDVVTIDAVGTSRDLERLSDLIDAAEQSTGKALKTCIEIIRDLYGGSDVNPS